MREADIYRAALEKWGADAQTLMVFEACRTTSYTPPTSGRFSGSVGSSFVILIFKRFPPLWPLALAALEKWGADAQTLMVFEEMAELQKELCKNARGCATISRRRS